MHNLWFIFLFWDCTEIALIDFIVLATYFNSTVSLQVGLAEQ